MPLRSLSILSLVVLLGFSGCGLDDDEGPLHVVLSHGNNSRPYLPWPDEVAKQVAGDLEDVGFTVEIRKEPWDAALNTMKNGRHQLGILGWSPDVADPDNFLTALLHKDTAIEGAANNISFYRSDEVSDLLDQAREEQDDAKRIPIYHQALRKIHADAPMVPLLYTDRMIAYRNSHGPLGVEWVTHPVLRLVETPANGELVFLRGGDSVRLDAGDATDGESSKVIEQVYDTLVRYTPGTSEVEPSLATSWTSSDDFKTWTFQIREGVKFHDGTPLDGAAVVATFERMRDRDHPLSFDDAEFSNWQGMFKFVEKTELGSHPMEVVFTCSSPAPMFLKQLGMFTCSIISPTALEKLGSKIRRSPVGTGPFKFVGWQQGVEIELERNDDYWDGPPKLERVFFRISNNATVRSNRLIANQGADLIDNLSPSTIAELEANPDVSVARREKSSLCYLSMNNLKPPFDDPRVRKAVAHAINKERIIQLAYKGHATQAILPMPPGFLGFDTSIEDYAYDPEKAKALLREAGLLP